VEKREREKPELDSACDKKKGGLVKNLKMLEALNWRERIFLLYFIFQQIKEESVTCLSSSWITWLERSLYLYPCSFHLLLFRLFECFKTLLFAYAPL
jgi:hypothetical protein